MGLGTSGRVQRGKRWKNVLMWKQNLFLWGKGGYGTLKILVIYFAAPAIEPGHEILKVKYKF